MSIETFFLDSNLPPPEDPQARLETSYIEAYLAGKGYRWCSLRALPAHQIKKLMTEACTYASNKLAEVETRSRLVRTLHGKE